MNVSMQLDQLLQDKSIKLLSNAVKSLEYVTFHLFAFR